MAMSNSPALAKTAFTSTDRTSAKRKKVAGDDSVQAEPPAKGAKLSSALEQHPLRVKPSGNAYTSPFSLSVSMGRFASLSDDLLLAVLEFLSARELDAAGRTCKALYAFSRHDELWRRLYLEDLPQTNAWERSWRQTVTRSSSQGTISCEGLFSDALYRPFQCAQISLEPYSSHIPIQNRIDRMSHLSLEDFRTSWSNKPFILTECVKSWPVFQDWELPQLIQKYGSVIFRAESVDWPLETYIDYMHSTEDESPLYLFDSRFVEKMQVRVGPNASEADYSIPECFQEDFFTVLGHQRPDHQWLIMGPKRSGSTFHKDPNGTSAWNAVIWGSKYWIMFPSSNKMPPPGVHVSQDKSEVTSPLSIAEWLLEFHAEARVTPGCVEGICHAGEVLHVPAGWFHLVVNLENCLAITQNFVSSFGLPRVLKFLRDKPDQVSGFDQSVQDPYGLFVERLMESYPDIAATALDRVSPARDGAKWALAVNEDAIENGEPFGFGFCNASDDEQS